MGRSAVFSDLQDLVKELGIQDGKELMTQGHLSLLTLRKKLAESENAALEEHASIRADAARAADKLGCTRDELLSGSATLPSIGHPRPMDEGRLNKMVERLVPDPKEHAKKLAAHHEAQAEELKRQAGGSVFNLPA